MCGLGMPDRALEFASPCSIEGCGMIRSRTPDDLTNWDALSLFLNVDGNVCNLTIDNTYRFDTQMNWWEARDNWQLAYRANNEGWLIEPIYFKTYLGW